MFRSAAGGSIASDFDGGEAGMARRCVSACLVLEGLILPAIQPKACRNVPLSGWHAKKRLGFTFNEAASRHGRAAAGATALPRYGTSETAAGAGSGLPFAGVGKIHSAKGKPLPAPTAVTAHFLSSVAGGASGGFSAGLSAGAAGA